MPFPQSRLHLPLVLASVSLFGLASSLAQGPPSSSPGPIAAPPSTPVLPLPANPRLPDLFLVGDSTVRNGDGSGGNGPWGWGEPLASFFDLSRINVVNRALAGSSSRTYIDGGHWADTLALVKPGDVILFQFGHNDNGPLADSASARGTLPGVGDETRDIINPTLGRPELVHTYGWYMRQYVAETIAHGGVPILCSPVLRKLPRDSQIIRNSPNYGPWARQIAVEQRIGFIDLKEIIASGDEQLGPVKVDSLLAGDETHPDRAGAERNAAAVVAGLKGLPHNPLVGYFSSKAAAVPPYQPPPPPPTPVP